MEKTTELRDLILSGLLEKLKSGTARASDYANAIKFLEKFKGNSAGQALDDEQTKSLEYLALNLPFPLVADSQQKEEL